MQNPHSLLCLVHILLHTCFTYIHFSDAMSWYRIHSLDPELLQIYNLAAPVDVLIYSFTSFFYYLFIDEVSPGCNQGNLSASEGKLRSAIWPNGPKNSKIAKLQIAKNIRMILLRRGQHKGLTSDSFVPWWRAWRTGGWARPRRPRWWWPRTSSRWHSRPWCCTHQVENHSGPISRFFVA